MTVAPESIASVRGEDAPLIQIKRSASCHFCLHEACQLSPKSNAGFFSSAMVASMRTGFLLPGEAHAVDLSEAWAAHADEFSQVFIRKGWPNQIGFRALSEQHGGGFIVEADRLRGKFASCKIKGRKEYGQTLNIGLRDRYHALERPVQPEGARTEQDIADVGSRIRWRRADHCRPRIQAECCIEMWRNF